jgi:transposase
MSFRWLVGLEMDDRLSDVTVFTRSRYRLLDGEIAECSGQFISSRRHGYADGVKG